MWGNELLFVVFPDSNSQPVEPLEDATFLDQISWSYRTLRYGELSLSDALKVWEIRLILLCFSNQLPAAKYEAVNLNNALYLHENPGAAPPRSFDQKPNTRAVYPLPKNNGGEISHVLTRLILRLKLLPSLVLVNELYKLCYQVRLRGSVSQAEDVQRKLLGLSYEIISVLMITKNYQTLISFLDSLRMDLKVLGDDPLRQDNWSRMTLLYVIVSLIFRNSNSKSSFSDLREAFVSVQKSSIHELAYVLRHFLPHVDSKDTTNIEEFDFGSLVQLATSDAISLRIVSCTAALWELYNLYDVSLDESVTVQCQPSEHGSSSLIDQVYAKVIGEWGEHFNRFYAIE